jgi:DNA uptake protein ComE-like DNA-binding protein
VLADKPQNERLNVNMATRDELVDAVGIGPVIAGRIVAARRRRPFTDLDDLRTRVKLSDRNWELISPSLTVRPPEE